MLHCNNNYYEEFEDEKEKNLKAVLRLLRT